MPAARQALFTASILLLSLLAIPATPAAQPRVTTIVACDPVSIRTWDANVDRMLRSATWKSVGPAPTHLSVDGRVGSIVQLLFGR